MFWGPGAGGGTGPPSPPGPEEGRRAFYHWADLTKVVSPILS